MCTLPLHVRIIYASYTPLVNVRINASYLRICTHSHTHTLTQAETACLPLHRIQGQLHELGLERLRLLRTLRLSDNFITGQLAASLLGLSELDLSGNRSVGRLGRYDYVCSMRYIRALEV